MIGTSTGDCWEQRTADFFRDAGLEYMRLGEPGSSPDGRFSSGLFVEVTHRSRPPSLSRLLGEEHLCNSVSCALMTMGVKALLRLVGGPQAFGELVGASDARRFVKYITEIARETDLEMDDVAPFEIRGSLFDVRVFRSDSFSPCHVGHRQCALSVSVSHINCRSSSICAIRSTLKKKFDQHKGRSQYCPYLVVLHDYYKVLFDDQVPIIVDPLWSRSHPRQHVAGVLVFQDPAPLSRPVLLTNPFLAGEPTAQILPERLLHVCNIVQSSLC